tara:strand:+ start:164 stop:400 length:237 start_codon:yes stop_codon:yes gene_type:complete
MDVFTVQPLWLTLRFQKMVMVLYMVFVVFGLSGAMIRTIMDGVITLQYMDLRTVLDAASNGLQETVVDVIVPLGIVVA